MFDIQIPDELGRCEYEWSIPQQGEHVPVTFPVWRECLLWARHRQAGRSSGQGSEDASFGVIVQARAQKTVEPSALQWTKKVIGRNGAVIAVHVGDGARADVALSMQELDTTTDEPVVVQCQEMRDLGPGCYFKERSGQTNTVLKVDQIRLPFAERLLEDRLDASIEVKILNPRSVLEVVDHAADRQAVELIIKEIIVSVLRGALAAEDPYVMTSTQTAAELMGILLNASGGCGRKPIGDLKDSHRTEKARLSSHSASRAVGLQPGPLLGKIRLGSGTQMKCADGLASPSATPSLVQRALLWATGGSSIAVFAHQVNSRQFCGARVVHCSASAPARGRDAAIAKQQAC